MHKGGLKIAMIKEVRVRIYDDKYHQKVIKQFTKDDIKQVRSVVTFLNPSPNLVTAIEMGLKDGKYQEIGTLNDPNFIELIPDQFEFNFNTYYDREKRGYQDSDKTSQPREYKRIHQGVFDLVHCIGKELPSKNTTMLTTLMLRYGVSKLYELIPKEEMDLISTYYNARAASAFKHDQYFEGYISKQLLTEPLNKYENSRTVIMDVTCRMKSIHYYPDEFVFQMLDQMSLIGFSGSKGKYAVELLLLLAIEDFQNISEYDVDREVGKLVGPTVKAIKKLTQSGFIHKEMGTLFEAYQK